MAFNLQTFANYVVEDKATVNATWLGLCVVEHHAHRQEHRSHDLCCNHLRAQMDPALGVVVVPGTYGAVGARISGVDDF